MSNTTDLMTKASALAAAFDENFLELARTLRQLQDESTEEFLATVGKAGIGERKAYYLVAVDRAFSTIPVPKARLKKVGWTKLNMLTKHINKANYGTLLKYAEKHTAKELETILRGEEPDGKKRAVLMYLSRDDYTEFERALLMFGGKRSARGMPNREEAVMSMTRWVLEQKDS